MSSKKNIQKELQARIKNAHETSVKCIANALLKELQSDPKSWVAKAAIDPRMGKYQSDLERILVLEKIVLLQVIGELWDVSGISNPDFLNRKLPGTQKKIKTAVKNDWVAVVQAVKWRFAKKYLGKPIQTNRPARYEGITREVINKIMSFDNQKPLVVLDAGAAGGFGILGAIQAGIPIEVWIALDSEDPKSNLPWVLACSIRAEQILEDDFSEKLSGLLKLPRQISRLRHDMSRKSNIPDSSINISLFIYSLYQLRTHTDALTEAARVTEKGGLIIVCDNFVDLPDGSFRVVSPGTENSKLQTRIWVVIDDSATLSEPIPIVEWKNTDFSQIKSTSEYIKKQAEIIRQLRSCALGR